MVSDPDHPWQAGLYCNFFGLGLSWSNTTSCLNNIGVETWEASPEGMWSPVFLLDTEITKCLPHALVCFSFFDGLYPDITEESQYSFTMAPSTANQINPPWHHHYSGVTIGSLSPSKFDLKSPWPAQLVFHHWQIPYP